MSVTSIKPERLARGIDHRKFAELAVGKNSDRFAHTCARRNGGGARNHEIRYGTVERRFVVLLEQSGKIAISEQARQLACGIGQHDGPRPSAWLAAADDDFSHRVGFIGNPAFGKGSHGVVYVHQFSSRAPRLDESVQNPRLGNLAWN